MIVEARPARAPVPGGACPVPSIVQRVASWTGLLRLKPSWDRLAALDPDGLLLGPALQAQAWKCSPQRARGEQLSVLAVTNAAGAVEALLPLRYNPRTHRLCFLEEARVQRQDLLADSEVYDAAWAAVAAHLRQRRDWDRLDLQYLRPAAAARVPAAFSAVGLAVRPRGVTRQRAIVLNRPWTAMESSFSPYLQANFRRRYKRLAARGAVRLHVQQHAAGLAPLLDACFQLEQSGWKGAAGTAMADDASLRRLYRRWGFALAARGQLRVFCLLVGDHLAAFEFCLFDPAWRRLTALKIGYDEQLRTASPGVVLRWLLLQHMHGGCEHYEFLGEDAPWKADWTGQFTDLTHLRIYNRTLGGALWRWRARAGAAARRARRLIP